MLLVKDRSPCSLHKIIYFFQHYFFTILFLLLFFCLFVCLFCFTVKFSVSHSVVSDSATPWAVVLLGSSGHGNFQARILKWVAISFSRRSSWPKGWTQVSHTAGRLSNLIKHICVRLCVDFLFCIFDQFSSFHTKASMFW